MNFSLFLAAALIIAAVPGPGIFYVAARTLSGGRKTGIASTLGTALGGLVHVIAGALGVSAIILASAELFTALKLAGALYLIWLGIRTFREGRQAMVEAISPASAQQAFREGVLVEALNPKTAAFFLAAALIIAFVPGPGIFYVAARTLSGGRKTGIASTLGTALGGLVHVIAGALGVSAIILASAELFTVLKLAGALYLVWLGVRTFREGRQAIVEAISPASARQAFREGVLVEALNPKTAAFFLAFIPQFIDPAGAHPALQFIALGLISVLLNTLADVVVVMMAATARAGLVQRPLLIQRLRQGSGLFIAGLGVSLALVRRPAN